LRGSGRFAVAAGRGRGRGDLVSIPFIAGQWSLRSVCVSAPPRRRVSIPFIAGQWSLRAGDDRPALRQDPSQSPSLRGSGRFPARGRPSARRVSIPFIAGQWSLRAASGAADPRPRGLNPLHCGAVVASDRRRTHAAASGAGLNPLHCGAVVASNRFRTRRPTMISTSQSPSLRGSGRFVCLRVMVCAV